MLPTLHRWSRRVLIASAALPLLQIGGCMTYSDRVLASVANQLPRTITNVAIQLVVSILTGTSNFLFQSGGQFTGGFGGS
ncbi:MAG: hypothetical protein L6Q92_03175 [Phycisphaerae bacterium]|nr:hypothetical protein [Phycisphaerae bacterium]